MQPVGRACITTLCLLPLHRAYRETTNEEVTLEKGLGLGAKICTAVVRAKDPGVCRVICDDAISSSEAFRAAEVIDGIILVLENDVPEPS
jgi:hypothetical protein